MKETKNDKEDGIWDRPVESVAPGVYDAPT